MKTKITLLISLMSLIVISVLSVFLTTTYKSNAQEFDSKIPVKTNQLDLVKGKIPVELKCNGAKLELPNKLESVDCQVINNTDKSITAMVLAYEILMEENGRQETFSSALSFEMLLHPNLYEHRKHSFIKPNGSTSIIILPTTFDPYLTIKEVSMRVDYVEFVEGFIVDEKDGEGKNLIKEFRKGIASYFNWLIEKSKLSTNSENALEKILADTKPIKELGLVFETSKEIEGAKVSRKYLNRLYKTKGVSEVKKVLELKNKDKK